MNNIVIDKEILLKDYVGRVVLESDNTVINVEGNCILTEISTKYQNVIINIKSNSTLEYNRFYYDIKDSGRLEVNQETNSYSLINEGIICADNFNLNVNINEKNDNLINKYYLRVFNKNGKNIVVNANGIVHKKTINNELTIDLRGLITDNNKIEILPNLLVDSHDVRANHNVTISNVNDAELFYLMSKGLTEKNATKLLINGFILGIYNNKELIEEIKEYL